MQSFLYIQKWLIFNLYVLMLRGTEELKMIPNLKMITGTTEQTLENSPLSS